MAERKHREHHLWPAWWDDVPHPDVPFPKFPQDRHVLLGNPPSPEEILEAAQAYAEEHGEGYNQ